MKLSDITPSERPREKLLARGPAALGNPELLAILLRTGTREDSVLDLAHRLLCAADGSLLTLSKMPLEALCAISGIKRDKAATVLAAFELGRRYFDETVRNPAQPLHNARMVYQTMIPRLKGLEREECWILLLNSAYLLTDRILLTTGSPRTTAIDPKDILKYALERRAHALILVHNHPSGDPRPSQNDVKNTRLLKKAAQAVDLVLVDHVILCDQAYYSFEEDTVSDVL